MEGCIWMVSISQLCLSAANKSIYPLLWNPVDRCLQTVFLIGIWLFDSLLTEDTIGDKKARGGRKDSFPPAGFAPTIGSTAVISVLSLSGAPRIKLILSPQIYQLHTGIATSLQI